MEFDMTNIITENQIHFSRKERRDMKKGKSSRLNHLKSSLKSSKMISNSMSNLSSILEEVKTESANDEVSSEKNKELENQFKEFNETLFNFYKAIDEKEMIREKAYEVDIKETNPKLGIFEIKVNRLSQYRAAKKFAIATEESIKEFSIDDVEFSNNNRLSVINNLRNYKHASFYHPSVIDFSKVIFEGDNKAEEKFNILKTCVFDYLSNINIRGNEEFITRLLVNFRYLKFYKSDCTSVYINTFVSACHNFVNKFLELKA
jgi:hypothetical protein